MADLASIGHTISIWLIPIVTAISFHEAAHGWVANRLGDDTAQRLGRVTLNPIKHADPIGTFALPGFLVAVGSPFIIGFAKPVPVAFHRLDNPKRDMIWVALAGPGINIILAFLCALVLHVVPYQSWLWQNLENALFINIVLACFNMLPIPPLDGGRVVTGLLPPRLAWRFAQVERVGLLLLLALIFVVPFVAAALGLPFNPLAAVLMPVIDGAHGIVTLLAGW